MPKARFFALLMVFAFLGFLLFYSNSKANPIPTQYEILKKPNLYFSETLKDGVTPYQFFKALSKINTFFGYERYFKKEALHNPFVWRQGGAPVPQAFPTATPIPGLPFDIFTPTGVIPGCLNLLCPPPLGAFWYAGVCWCTP